MTRAKDISKIVTDADLSGTLDVTGAVTTGGNVGINESNPSSSLHIYGSTPKITLEHSNENGTAQIYTQSQSGIILDADPDNTDNGTPIQLKTDGKARLLVEDSGDISFYEDTGTTPKFIWDSSAESLTVDGVVTVDRVINATTSSDPWLKGVNGSNTETFFLKPSGQAYFGSNVGIGTSSPSALLQVEGADGLASGAIMYTASGVASGYMSADAAGLCLATDTAGITFRTGITGADPTDTGSERMRITSTGRFLVGGLTTSNASDEALQVYRNGATVLSVARQQDGTLVNFRVGSVDGAAHGSISISGVTCSYNAFSGSHWSRLSDNSKPTILKGTIIETIDEMCDWYRAEFTVPATDENDEYVRSESIALPSGKSVGDTITYTYEGTDYTATIIQEGDEKHVKCKISDTADSTRVYGIFSAWDNDDDSVNDMYVTAVGTHVVRVHSSATISAGDLLVSNGDGTAKVQDDDIIRSKTIGKVLTNIVQETYDDGSYTVPCALYCG